MPDLRSDLIRLAHANPELRPHLLPLLRQGSGTARTAAVAGDSIEGHIGKAFTAILSAYAKGFKKEVEGDFKSLKLDGPGSDLGLNGGAALLDFTIEDSAVEQWGYPPDGWVAFNCSWMPGDKYPSLVAAVQYNGQQKRFFGGMLDDRRLRMAPNAMWAKDKAHVVSEFTKVLHNLSKGAGR